MTDRQRERKREMNGCRQEALTINMAREHAATPRRNTGGEDDRGKARSSTTHTEETNFGKRIATVLALAGNSTPALTNKHHRSAASPRVRGFGPPHNKRTHRQQSHTMHEEKRHTATASSSTPRTTGYSHSPAANTTHTEQAITQRATRKSDSASIHDAATTFPVISPTMEFDARLKAVIGGASRLQEK
ncbi:hypothetical protein TCDM_12766 [Trypanosoma cruzi Dm28c]|uniref:Uncharacterized protein n=1 Tax=Trypanosoma cruzi Dm28c TaxID=1416333 RepID=V5AKG5_TRYCR|nr:hypothetical protein TCDM_12766 [Trypanosoma cruzi Dm28c]